MYGLRQNTYRESTLVKQLRTSTSCGATFKIRASEGSVTDETEICEVSDTRNCSGWVWDITLPRMSDEIQKELLPAMFLNIMMNLADKLLQHSPSSRFQQNRFITGFLIANSHQKRDPRKCQPHFNV